MQIPRFINRLIRSRNPENPPTRPPAERVPPGVDVPNLPPSGHMLLDHNVGARELNGGQLYRLPFPSQGINNEQNFPQAPPFGLEPVRGDIRPAPPGPPVPITGNPSGKSRSAFNGEAYATDHRREALPVTGAAAAQQEAVRAREALEVEG